MVAGKAESHRPLPVPFEQRIRRFRLHTVSAETIVHPIRPLADEQLIPLKGLWLQVHAIHDSGAKGAPVREPVAEIRLQHIVDALYQAERPDDAQLWGIYAAGLIATNPAYGSAGKLIAQVGSGQGVRGLTGPSIDLRIGDGTLSEHPHLLHAESDLA